MLGVIFGILYWMCYDRQKTFAILDVQMCITLTVVMIVFLPWDVVMTFPKERAIFLRERRAGLYTSSSFYIARVSADAPLHIVAAVTFATIVYLMSGLRMGLHIFIAINVYGILVGAAVLQAIGAVSRSLEEGNMLMMLVMMTTMMLTSG